MKGIDYAWAQPKPSPSALKAAGVMFIARYLSHDPSKDLVKSELDAAVAAGLDVVLVWEQTAQAMLGGHRQGVDDAQNADGQASLLGMKNAPIYFACDFDSTPAQQAAINSYLDGVASVIGKARTGIYSGYYPLKRAFDAGKVTYGWQTYAWSGGNWDTRAQLRQTHNGVTVAGQSADWDQSMKADYGQWPRPGSPRPSHPTVQAGVTGQAVKTLQVALNKAGFGPLIVDGVFGVATTAAVRSYQSHHSLAVDGVVGPATWAKLS